MNAKRNIPFFQYPGVFQKYEDKILEIVADVGRRGAFILQKDVDRFEKNLAEYTGVKYALGVANATDALYMLCRAAGLGLGDEVIFCTHTMVATASGIHFAGATPVSVETGWDHEIDPRSVEKAITAKTKAIMPTQLNGRCADMDALRLIAEKHGLFILEGELTMAHEHSKILKLAKKIRIHATRMIHTAKSSHLGSNLSMAEIMAVLYGKILHISPDEPSALYRDRLILSKGHAAAGYYAVLAECGFFPIEWLDSFYLNCARLAGHVTCGVPGIEVSSGALGHGLPMAAGMALAGKRDHASHRIFAVLSDGECDEGSTWEAAMFSAHHHLSNLIAIIDYNKIQALGHTRDVIDLEPFADKWKAFGWAVIEVDGHDIDELETALATIPFEPNRPSCLIAHTVKGKGVSFMEDDLLWHYRNPQGEEYENAMQELGAKP